jgi:hypothetical protein
MQPRSREELYRSFIDFIGTDVQRERRHVNRKMFGVVIWCFILPAVVSATILLLIHFKVFPRTVKSYADWVILVFPVIYSLYILSSEVLSQVPSTLKRGGIATTLSQATREGEWRRKVCDGMATTVNASYEDWKFLVTSFRMDLGILKQRTNHLTALAGAVFFLILHGIDSLGESVNTRPVNPYVLMEWVESANNDISQMVGLALFLVLLYLSGNQTYHSMLRYLNCAELMMIDVGKAERTRRSVD